MVLIKKGVKMDSIKQYKALMNVYVCTHKWVQFYKNENGFYFAGAKKYYKTLSGAKIAASKF